MDLIPSKVRERVWKLVIDKTTEPPTYRQEFYEDGRHVETRDLTPEEAAKELAP